MKKIGLNVWIEGAIIAAVAMALQYIPNIPPFDLAIGIIPIVLYSFRRGLVPGLYAGLIMGLLHFTLGKVEYLNPVQIITEYVFAFAAIGLAGMVGKQVRDAITNKAKGQTITWIIVGSLLGVGVKYLFHFIAGVAFWGSFAPKGMNAWIYSLWINGTSGLINLALTIFVMIVLFQIAPFLFIPKDARSLTSTQN